MWHVSSRSGVATLRTAMHLLHFTLYGLTAQGREMSTLLTLYGVRHVLPSPTLPAIGRRADTVVTSVSLHLYMFARISHKPHVQTSPNFRCTFPAAVAGFCSGRVAICYLLSVRRICSLSPVICAAVSWGGILMSTIALLVPIACIPHSRGMRSVATRRRS